MTSRSTSALTSSLKLMPPLVRGTPMNDLLALAAFMTVIVQHSWRQTKEVVSPLSVDSRRRVSSWQTLRWLLVAESHWLDCSSDYLPIGSIRLLMETPVTL
jgi:hypothetical protein